MMNLLSLVILLLITIPAQAKKWTLDLSNLSAESKNSITQHFPDLQKESLSLEKVDDIIRILQQNPNNELIQVFEEKEGVLQLAIQTSKRISQVNFQGIKNLSDSDIKTIFQINKNDIFEQQNLIEGGERIRQYYHDNGFLNAVIDIEFPTDSNGQIIVNVHVHENNATEVESLNIISQSDELKANLERILRSQRGRPLTENNLNDAQKIIRDYLKSNFYLRADVSGAETKFNADETKAQINFKIDRAESYSVSFSGNTEFNTYILKNDILDLQNFHTTNPKVASELVEKLKSTYLARGYARIEIQTQETEGKRPFTKEIEFLINEGPKVQIDKIMINGRMSRPADYYSQFLRNHSSALVKSGLYNKEDLDVGIHNLVNELQNQGYLLAKVISTRLQYNREKNKVSFYINLDEGALTEVEKIEFSGHNAFSFAQLMAVSELSPSGPLHLNQIEKAVALIKSFYQDNGFIEMILLNEKDGLVTYSENNTKARLNFKIFEGPQVRVGSILIDGNFYTKDFVILNELEFKNGDIVTLAKLEESTLRLQKTGFFNSVEVRTLEEKTNVSNRTIIVKITERDPGLINVGIGATNERTLTFRGYTGAAYRNLLGIGWGASARAEVNYNVTDIRFPESKITLGTVIPYLFNSRVRGRLNLTRSKTVTDYDLKKVSELNQTTWSVEKDFTTHVTGSWDLLSIATVHDFGLDPTAGVQDTLLDIGSTGPSVDIDYRDNAFNPTKGTLTHLAVEYADAGFLRSSPSINYYKTSASFSHYWKITDAPVVWANSIRGGYLENLNHDPGGGVPYDKKGFILGGRSTIRGYEAASIEVFPNRNDLGSDTYLLTTRATMGLFKSEVRFPIFGNFGMAVFYDAGYVSIAGLDFTDNFRDSTGFGFRYNTPVGPLNLEWGWKLKRHPGEDQYRFHLSIGTF